MVAAGDTAPDFTVDSTDGMFTLSERVRDGPVLLYFYVINFGKTCTNYLAELNEHSDDFRDRGISLYQLNDDSVENHLDWMRHTASRYDILSDPERSVCGAFDCFVTKARSDKIIGRPNRAFFLIGKDMRILYSWQADDPMDTVPVCDLLKAIDGALGE